MFAEFTVYVGLNDRVTREQIVTEEAAREIIINAVHDCTIQNAHGAYTHDDGGNVRENTLIVTIFADTAELERLQNACREIKAALNQESIILSYRPAGNTSFI